ncbi:hypothetical protein GL263_23285, partial [Streptomyces durbertensis]|nr:hypothetical protein [Streptomyces durbertensis]
MRADDRYDWLDDKAAETLLRGRPVGDTSVRPLDDTPATGDTPPAESGETHSDTGIPPKEHESALELIRALEGLAAEHRHPPTDTELPGEAEALAAFRTARTPGAGPGAPRGSKLSRIPGKPLRAGLAMTLAGCALGGVAMAATSGFLPGPFRSDGAQDPKRPGGGATSVEVPGGGVTAEPPGKGTGGPGDGPGDHAEPGDHGSHKRHSEGGDRPGDPRGSAPGERGDGGHDRGTAGSGGGHGDTRDVAGAARGGGERPLPGEDAYGSWPHRT